MASLAHDGLIPAGLLEYAPLAHAAEPVRGGDHWIIHCIWVIPPFAARRLGSELVVGALRDLRSDPSVPPDAGLAVIAYRGTKWWGFFDYMPEALFTLHGFRPVDQDGPRVLMYRSLAPGASATPPGGEEPPGRLPYLIRPASTWRGPNLPGPARPPKGGPNPETPPGGPMSVSSTTAAARPLSGSRCNWRPPHAAGRTSTWRASTAGLRVSCKGTASPTGFTSTAGWPCTRSRRRRK